MVDEQRLTELLIDFARTLTQEYPIQAILDNFVECLPQVVPVTGAGVLLIGDDHEMHFVAASDEVLLQIEGLQTEFDEGPCLETYRSGEPVLIPDLAHDRRFPRFSPRARDDGLAAVFAFPMSVDDHRLGALDVWRDTPGQLAPADVASVQLLADVAASYVISVAQVRWVSSGAWIPPEARRCTANRVPIAAPARARAGLRVATVASCRRRWTPQPGISRRRRRRTLRGRTPPRLRR